MQTKDSRTYDIQPSLLGSVCLSEEKLAVGRLTTIVVTGWLAPHCELLKRIDQHPLHLAGVVLLRGGLSVSDISDISDKRERERAPMLPCRSEVSVPATVGAMLKSDSEPWHEASE
eukprot:2359500-Pleurochrysis_carterae.AAC.1